jgi:RimJ/RimL family protein N-acetyltransferase
MSVHIEPWGEGDLPLLEKTLGDPEAMTYLGGPESPEKLAERHDRFLRLPGTGQGQMFRIVDDETGIAVGHVGFWERTWRDEDVYETGWNVVTDFQGRGIATTAMQQLIARLKAGAPHRFLHAFPGVENAPSNSICRKLGFTLLEDCEFEYPKGSFMRCNDWRLDLTTDAE